MQYRDHTLYLEDVPLADIARREGTPCYVYSRAAILDRFQAYDAAFGAVPHKVCYAVKANANLAILKLLAEAGAGFDIVSGGELFRVLKAGADPAGVIFSGVGKTAQEIDYALEHHIRSFNCESEPELALIDSLAARAGREGARGLARESRRRRGHASIHLYRTAQAQVRHRYRGSRSGLRARPSAAEHLCWKA